MEKFLVKPETGMKISLFRTSRNAQLHLRKISVTKNVAIVSSELVQSSEGPKASAFHDGVAI